MFALLDLNTFFSLLVTKEYRNWILWPCNDFGYRTTVIQGVGSDEGEGINLEKASVLQQPNATYIRVVNQITSASVLECLTYFKWAL